MTDLNELRHRLPHRAPFHFVDHVIDCESGSAAASWDISGEEDFLKGHFPGRPIIPGVLIAEALAQTAGIAATSISDTTTIAGSPGFLVHLNLKFPGTAQPPLSIHLTASLTGSLGDLHRFEVRASASDVVFAEGQLALKIPSALADTDAGLMPR